MFRDGYLCRKAQRKLTDILADVMEQSLDGESDGAPPVKTKKTR